MHLLGRAGLLFLSKVFEFGPSLLFSESTEEALGVTGGAWVWGW